MTQTSKPYTHEQYEAAFEILRKHGFWWESLLPFRNALIAGDLMAARAFASSELSLDESETDVLLAYFDPAVRGEDVRIVEMSVEDIPLEAFQLRATDDESDPLEWHTRYLVRVGCDVGRAFLISSNSGGGFRFFFNGNQLDSKAVNQLWRIERTESE